MAITIDELHEYLQEEMRFSDFSDIDTLNGIQVGRNTTELQSLAFAVDSSLASIEKAVELSADMLMVHHGLYWGGVPPMVGVMHTKFSRLISHDIALYAMHLPLDAHMKYGNNVQLARFLGLEDITEFGVYKGRSIGVRGRYAIPISREDVLKRLFSSQDAAPAPYLDYYSLPNVTIPPVSAGFSQLDQALHGRKDLRSVAVLSGGVVKHTIDEAVHHGVDLLICGDASHTVWLEAQEKGINVIFAGHYFTETWGIMSLGRHLCEKFLLKGVFIHVPTGY